MADNITFQTTVATPPSGSIVATDNIGGIDYQRVKVVWGADGTVVDASATDPLPVSQRVASSGTQTSVAGSASSVTILAANASRLGATVYNDSTATLYLLLHTSGTAVISGGNGTNGNFTLALGSQQYYEVPFNYTGGIVGIWTSAAGFARVTEFVT